MKINQEVCKEFRKDFNLAIKELEKKYGATIKLGNISYTDTTINSKISVALEVDGDARKGQFEGVIEMYGGNYNGIKAEHYNMEFKYQGETYRLVGINTRKPKNCLIILDKNGKELVGPISIIRNYIPHPLADVVPVMGTVFFSEDENVK